MARRVVPHPRSTVLLAGDHVALAGAATAAVTITALWWLRRAFVGVPGHAAGDDAIPGCRELDDDVRAALDTAIAAPLLLLTGCLVASAIAAARATARGHGGRAGVSVGTVLGLSALLGSGVAVLLASDGSDLASGVAFLFVVPVLWIGATVALVVARITVWPGGRRVDLVVWVLPTVHLVVVPAIVAELTATGARGLCM